MENIAAGEEAGESREVPNVVIEEGKTRASGGDQYRRTEGGPMHTHKERGKIEVYKTGKHTLRAPSNARNQELRSACPPKTKETNEYETT